MAGRKFDVANKMRFRRCLCIALVFAVCVSAAGCGGTAVTEDGSATGGVNAGTGRAASKGAVSERQQSSKRGRYCTDTNLYVESGTCLVQMRLDGSCRKVIDLGEKFSSIVGVTDTWVYYATYEGEREYGQHIQVFGVYRLPVYKGADGFDVVDTTKVEKIVGKETGDAMNDTEVFVDDTVLLYEREYGHHCSEIVVYDLQKRKEAGRIRLDCLLDIWRLGEQYAVLTEENLYLVSPETAKGTGILDDGYVTEYWVNNERFLFYSCSPEQEEESDYTPGPDDMDKDIIRLCDGEKDRGLVTRREMKDALESAVQSVWQMSADELDKWEISNLLCDGGRCYIEVQAAGMHDGNYHVGFLTFSKAEGDEKVRFEKNLTESMREKNKQWRGRWYTWEKGKKKVIQEHSIVSPVRASDLANGKLYFYFHDENKEIHFAYYDLDAGGVTEITHSSPEYFERFYSQRHDEEESAFLTQNTDEGFGVADEQMISDILVFSSECMEFEETAS